MAAPVRSRTAAAARPPGGCRGRWWAPRPATRRGCSGGPTRTATPRAAERVRPAHPVGRLGELSVGSSAAAADGVTGRSGRSGRASWCAPVRASASRSWAGRRSRTRPSGRPGRSTPAAFAAPATGSTQCQAFPATTASNAGRPGPIPRTSPPRPRCRARRANSAIRASSSTPCTRQPAAELSGGDPGADADVEHIGAGTGGDDPLDHRVGISRPGAVVALGVDTERLRHLPLRGLA